MKTFLLKLTFFSLTCFVLLNLVAIFYDQTSRRRVEDPGGEIYDATRRAHEPSSATRVVIGDSVGHQLLTGYAPAGTLSLCTNQAISMCGQYLLARTAIDHDPAVKELVLAYQPIVFVNNLDQKFGYNYFVRPFYPYAEYRAQMSPLVKMLIDRRPAARLVVLPLFRYTTFLFDINYAEGAPKPTYTYLAPVSVEYLHKLSTLCTEKKIHLRIVSTPISRDRNYDRVVFEKEIAGHGLENLFAGYADTVRLVDPQLLVDGVHFKEDKVSENSAIFVKMLDSVIPSFAMNPAESEHGWEPPRQPFVTYTLGALCVLNFLWQLKAGRDTQSEIAYPGHVSGFDLFSGQYWGLLTAFFYHANFAHIGFNMYWLYHFGRAVEAYLGWWRYILFWVAAMAVSSMVEVMVSGTTGVGASGFGYALFGFVWIGSRKHPYLAQFLDPQTVLMFIAWFFICIFSTWTGAMSIANGAHAGGMLFGMMCAYAYLVRTDRRLQWATIVICLLCFVPLFYAPWSGTWNLLRATKAMDRNDYSVAVAYLDRLGDSDYGTYPIKLKVQCLEKLHRWDEAAAAYRYLLSPEYKDEASDLTELYNSYAWLAATAPDAKVRNPQDAIKYALRACEKDGYANGYILDTLATAYASNGQFDQAVSWEEKAINVHTPDSEEGELESRLKLFKSKRPYVDTKDD